MGPILVTRRPSYVVEELPRRRRRRVRTSPGGPTSYWMNPHGTRVYRTRKDALAGRG